MLAVLRNYNASVRKSFPRLKNNEPSKNLLAKCSGLLLRGGNLPGISFATGDKLVNQGYHTSVCAMRQSQREAINDLLQNSGNSYYNAERLNSALRRQSVGTLLFASLFAVGGGTGQ